MPEDRERIIDRVLDDTLREIAAVDPPRGLQHRVMARVAGRALPHYDWWRFAAAAAVLVLAVSGWLVWRGGEESGDVPRQADVRPQADAPREVRLKPDTTPGTTAAREVRLKPDTTPDATAARGVRLKPDGTAASAGEIAPAAPIPPLPPPEPLAIAALQPPPISLETIDVQPLAAETPLDITPLNPSAGEPAGPESKE